MVPTAVFPGHAALPGGAAERRQTLEESARAERAGHRGDDAHLRNCNAVIDHHIQATDGEVWPVERFLVDEDT